MTTCADCGNPEVAGKFCGTCGAPASQPVAGRPATHPSKPGIVAPVGTMSAAQAGPYAPPMANSMSGHAKFYISDLLRDIGVIALLIWAMFLEWMPGKPGTTVWILLPLILGLFAPLGPLFIRLLRGGLPVSPKALSGARLLCLAPLVPALATCVIIDIANSPDEHTLDVTGLSSGFLMGVFALGIGLVPRNSELDLKFQQQATVVRWRIASGVLVLIGSVSYTVTTVFHLLPREDRQLRDLIVMSEFLITMVLVAGWLFVMFARPAIHIARNHVGWQMVLMATAVTCILVMAVRGGHSYYESASYGYGLWVIALGAGMAALPLRLGTGVDSRRAAFWVDMARAAISNAASYFLIVAFCRVAFVFVELAKFDFASGAIPVGVVVLMVIDLMAGLGCVLAVVRLRQEPRSGRIVALIAMPIVLALLLIDFFSPEKTALGTSVISLVIILMGPILLAFTVLVAPQPVRAEYGRIIPAGALAVAVQPASFTPPGQPFETKQQQYLTVAGAPAAMGTPGSLDAGRQLSAPGSLEPEQMPLPAIIQPPVAVASAPAQAPSQEDPVEEATLRSAVKDVRDKAVAADLDSAVAADPDADPHVLMDIAARRADLHIALAQNPASYDGLLGWLYELGDQGVRDVLTRRGFTK